jgi:malonyl-CoA/methylmalonyl-CoA synthetase
MTSPLASRLGALARAGRIAVEDDHGARSFDELLERALGAGGALAGGAPSLEGRRVVLLVSPGVAWVESFLAIVLGGGVAVPVSPLHPAAELAWFAADAGADLAVVSSDLADRAAAFGPGVRFLGAADLEAGPQRRADPDALAPDRIAMLLYTSGTTGKPKGAMLTHAGLAHQAALLGEAWGLGAEDTLLHALPMHHMHGIAIALLPALLSGARTRFVPRFEARRIWDELGRASVWMAVPTMYQKLVDALDAEDAAARARHASYARGLRLATSGSAALPTGLAGRWADAAGAIPLERFGMTEIGVGMSNPLEPSGRRPGFVGPPLRTVETRLVDDAGRDTERGPGELYVRGPSLFAGYWQRPDATAAAFVEGDAASGWFKTGDLAERAPDGFVRVLGRTSVDILKSGGYKLSALEIEEALREHAAVAEVAVVGVPDATWGDRVVAVVVPAPGRADECRTEALRAWAKDRIAPYKVPREVVLVDALPRNAMGKVVKPELVRALGPKR